MRRFAAPSLRARGLRALATGLGAGLVAALFFAARAGSASSPVVLPDPAMDQAPAAVAGQQVAIFAGGCFWGVEGVYRHVKGVVSATSGYVGGSAKTATYEQVTQGTSGHAEAVRVVYDTSKVTYGQLLKVFFSVVHDPTQLNRQGPDVGSQYRSGIWYTTDGQRKIAESYIAQLTRAKSFADPIVTTVEPLKAFYEAEEYHQDYMARNPRQPYIVMHDAPKLKALQAQFAELYR
jgi:peptide-methionine (S)-S-oxide reductase